MEIAYDLKLNVRYGEVGHDGVVTLTNLANWLQEAAGQSADSLGFGEDALTAYGVTWILTRLVLRIRRLPGAGENICIRSWPSLLDRFGHRGYEVRDEAGELLVSGGSAWSVMDMTTRRLGTIPAELADRYPSETPACDAFTCRVLPRLGNEQTDEQQARILVRKDDLDINCHVNNARYLSWLLEPLPYEAGVSSTPGLIDLAFRAECFPGEELLSVCQPKALEKNPDPALFPSQPKTMVHAIRRLGERGGEDVCRALSCWR